MSAPAHPTDQARSVPDWPALPGTFVAGAMLLVAIAALAGWIGRTATMPAPAAVPTPPAREVALGPVSLSAPGAWEPVGGRVAGVPDLGAGTAAFAPVPGLGGRAVVALAPFDDPTLVPAPLRALAGSEPARATLAGLPAWTYGEQAVAGGRIAQLTVAPTTAGAVTALCIAPAASWSGAAGCADELAAASLRGASPLVPSATLAFRRQLVPVLDRLGARRADLRGRLRTARTPRGQARLARRMARANGRAATALAPRTASPGTRNVVRILRGTEGAYGRLALAARRGWPVRYKRARAAVRRHDGALARAVARVR